MAQELGLSPLGPVYVNELSHFTESAAGLYVNNTASISHDCTSVLTGAGTSLSGTAARTHAHTSTGIVIGAGSTLSGTANRTHVHASSGVLTGPGSIIVGSANRTAATAAHACSGVLTGVGSTLTGSAQRYAGPVTLTEADMYAIWHSPEGIIALNKGNYVG